MIFDIHIFICTVPIALLFPLSVLQFSCPGLYTTSATLKYRLRILVTIFSLSYIFFIKKVIFREYYIHSLLLYCSSYILDQTLLTYTKIYILNGNQTYLVTAFGI